MFDLAHQLKILPNKPGVYLMKNSLGEVIYVGKAKILKNRVRQYFQNSKNHSEKVKKMVSNIEEFEYIVTDSEFEALILECNLIKKYRPRYNIRLKDDKHYPMIKVTMQEDYPRVFVTRNIIKDGSKYFGPYTDSGAVYETVDTIKNLFPIRECRLRIKENEVGIRPCLDYYIKKCNAPCAGKVTKKEYKAMIDDVIDILSGKDIALIKELKEDMIKASENLEFEKAAMYRDKIMSFEKIISKQKMITGRFEDEDFISLAKDEKDALIQIFFMRQGKINGREHFIIEDGATEENSVLIAEFIKEFYGNTAFIPKTIYVDSVEDQELLEELLTARRESKVWIKIPQKGDKKKTLDLVENNAVVTLRDFKDKIIKDKERGEEALRTLEEVLDLEEIPKRIEAYDISNIQGVDSVGAMVVFEKGKAKNSDYRRFKIKTVVGANDYESMREVLRRRFKRGLEELEKLSSLELELDKTKFTVFPDLILMDGGKGHVSVAKDVLKEFNLDIPVAGMVKDNKHTARGLIYENEEISFKATSPVMGLIRKISDEVHRFAITYHRSLRDKRSLRSVLDNVPNIGEKRRKNLLIKFGSVENIKKSNYDEIISTPSMDKKSTESLMEYLSIDKKE